MDRIVVCTTVPALAEPRAPKVAVALAHAYPSAEITFVDACPEDAVCADPSTFAGLSNLKRRVATFPMRRSSPLRWASGKAGTIANRLLPAGLVRFYPPRTTLPAAALWSVLRSMPADVYVGHNIDALPLVSCAARRYRARVVFDSMEFYSDMGLDQAPRERDRIRRHEEHLLPRCDLLLASSEPLAEALQRRYRIEHVVPVYNTPRVVPSEQLSREREAFALYWRNAVVDVGQRGAGDLLQAMRRLPQDVVLYVQGRRTSPNRLQALAEELGVASRVFFLDPFSPHQAVSAASGHALGVCPEQDTCENQRLTVSNKIFDYMMAGLAIVAADLPGIGSIVRRSGAGLVYRSGDATALADAISSLYENRGELQRHRQSARHFALSVGNEAVDMARMTEAFAAMLSQPRRA